MSKYMVLLYANESGMPKPGTPEFDMQNAAYGAVYEDFSKRGAFVSGDPLTPSAAATSVGLIDCDVHVTVPNVQALFPYLPQHWVEPGRWLVHEQEHRVMNQGTCQLEAPLHAA